MISTTASSSQTGLLTESSNSSVLGAISDLTALNNDGALQINSLSRASSSNGQNQASISSTGEPLPQTFTETASRADTFIDTIGVNTHLNYSDTIYYSQYDSLIKPKLLELGVRHLRDGVLTYPGVNSDVPYYQRIRDLASHGIKFDLVTSMDTSWGRATDYSLLDEAYNWSNGAIASFEGINEPDLQNVSNWASVTRAAQKQLYETVKGNPTLKNVPVLAPSIFRGQQELGDLSAWVDYGNIHNYWGERNPESTGWGDNGYGSIDWNLNYNAKPVSGLKQVISTETGWHNAIGDMVQLRGLPEDVEGKYVPRLFFNQFNEGIVRTYDYQFIDTFSNPTDPEANFGLLRSDGSPKPAYTTLKNLIGLLEDPAGTNFTPKSLTYTLNGDTSNMEHTLLQKRNGDFYLALWASEPSWNPTTHTPISVPNRTVSLTLPSTIAAATSYTFNVNGSLSAAATPLSNHQLSVEIKDSVTILKLTPSQGTARDSGKSRPIAST